MAPSSGAKQHHLAVKAIFGGQSGAAKKEPRTLRPGVLDLLEIGRLALFVGFLALALERGAEDVAKRRARVGGAVLGNRLLLLLDFERLDRELHLGGAAIEQDDAGI